MRIHIPFSVCMSVYKNDKAMWFETAVSSIWQQTIRPSEIILVVDGPIPDHLENSIQFIQKEIDCFKVVRLERNCGHATARQKGLEAASNEWVAIMDSDDVSVINRFEKQLNYIENYPEVDVIGGQISEFIDNISDVVGKRVVPESDSEIKEYLRKRCPFNQMTVMMKKSKVLSVGGYIDWYCDEDYYLWSRLYLANAKFANLPDTLVNVRVGKDMYARRGGWKYFKSEERLQRYMLKNQIVNGGGYLVNTLKRFIVQVMLPNALRGWVFKHFARE